MERLSEKTYDSFNAILECECGAIHDGRVNVVVNEELITVLKKIKERGRVLVIASNDVEKEYLDNLHEKIMGEYEVKRFCSYEDCNAESIEGVDIVVAVGGDRIISRAKLLALSYSTSLVVIPTGINYGEYVSSHSVVEYGEVSLIRPSRAPDCVLADTKLLLSVSKSAWADCLGEIYAKAVSFFDYSYKVAIKGEGCEHIVGRSLDILEEGLLSFDKNDENVLRLVKLGIALASLYKMIGLTSGGEEQVTRTLLRFAKNRERRGTGDGEVRFLSAVLVARLYKKFLSKQSRFGVWDTFLDMDKTRRLLSIDELEVVRLAKNVNSQISDYRDYKMTVNRRDLYALAMRCDDILTRAHYKLVKIYPDGGYHLRYYLTSEEILGVVECAPFFCSSDTLLTFIKGSGLLTLTGA